MSETSVISVAGLSRSYSSEGAAHTAVRDVTVAVSPGEFVAVMGPSGCGKTTLLNMIGGLDRPNAGMIQVAGTRIDTMSETQLALFRRHHVGIVFQFFNLVHNLNVTDNIELPALLTGAAARQVRARSQELLAQLEIADLAQRMPGHLSGGQRQRVAIARALINRPTILLADEPTGALDQEAGRSVLQLLQRLHKQGQTIIMVTHDPKVSGFAERILVMQDGRIVEDVQPAKRASGGMAQRLLGFGG